MKRTTNLQTPFTDEEFHTDFANQSDVDVLVEFEPDARVGLITLAGIEFELGRLIGQRVEIHTIKGLNPRFRDEVIYQTQSQ